MQLGVRLCVLCAFAPLRLCVRHPQLDRPATVDGQKGRAKGDGSHYSELTPVPFSLSPLFLSLFLS
jgi:hypothetical protein